MTTICNLSVPAEEFGLAETLRTVSDTQVAYESVVASSPTESMPLIRVRAPDCQQLESALTSDATVAEWTRLSGGETGWFYRIEWSTRVSLVHRMLTGKGTTILSATGSGRKWALRVLYPSREACSEINTVCKTHDLGITVTSIRDSDGEQSTLIGLTDAQHTALTRAHNMGYFKVPRDAGLETVADTLDISHQALSERLRRAHNTLIETTIGQLGATQTTVPTETAPVDELAMRGQQLPTD